VAAADLAETSKLVTLMSELAAKVEKSDEPLVGGRAPSAGRGDAAGGS